MGDSTKMRIGIIGGGFCGVMTLVHLVKNAGSLELFLFNKDYPTARGIAYKTFSDQHLLNVEARNMSAFPAEPDHFVNWCTIHQVKPTGADIPTSYLPRNVYGKYLEEIFRECLENCPDSVKIHLVETEITDLSKLNDAYQLTTSDNRIISVDKVVLATGNAVPQDPKLLNNDFLSSRFYFGNPWNHAAVKGVEKEDTILIIGTGLTMVDIVLSLEENNFNGRIIAMSPHGFRILPHRRNHLQRSILDELSPPYKLDEVFRLFYKHVRQARLHGSSGEAVVDAVRSKTQEIWQQLSLAEKRRFMTHLRHMWGVARHRLPKDIHGRIESMIDQSRLQVIAGKLTNAIAHETYATVFIALKNGSMLETTVNRVINCTGPQSDIRKQNSLLFRNLLKKKVISADEMNLGIHASANGRIIGEDGIPSDSFFALGTLLKGKLWESTAVPELRVQAARIADLLLKTNAPVNEQ